MNKWGLNVASVLLSFCNHIVADYGHSLSDLHFCLLHPWQVRTTTRDPGNASPGTWPCVWLPADSSTVPCATAELSRRRTSGSTWRASSIRPKCRSWGTVMKWRTSATAKRPRGQVGRFGGLVLEEKLHLHLFGRILEILRPLDLLSSKLYMMHQMTLKADFSDR